VPSRGFIIAIAALIISIFNMPMEILWDRVVAHSDPIKGFFGKIKRKGLIQYYYAQKANSSSVILFHAIAEIPLDV
jgi:hypothetical protein